MSNLIFPNLVGLSWEGRQRSPEFKTLLQTSVSGLDAAIQLWAYPRYTWQLSFDVLRSDNVHLEWQALLGFFLQVGGCAGTWLFEDWEDNWVSGQPVGTGDGSTKSFQLYRTLGGSTEPVLAINLINQVYFNGVAPGVDENIATVGGLDITIGGEEVTIGPAAPWTTNGGILTFATAPPAGTVITSDFLYYWKCRFSEDTFDADALYYHFWQLKKITFKSIKLGSG